MDIYKKLFKYIPDKKNTALISVLLSTISAFFMIFGYYYIYCFLSEVIVYDNLKNISNTTLKIVLYLTASGILYILSGVVSHKVAFNLETNLRKKGIDGLMDSSFRFHDINSSGYIRKTIDDNAVQTHMMVAHMLPDFPQAFLVLFLSIILSFIIDYRVGMSITILVTISALILMKMMGNSEFMKLYQKSLDTLSEATVEYVRGIQVVKIFRTRLKSFKALHSAIIAYSDNAYNYSLTCKKPYVIYQLIFLGIIPIIVIPLSFVLYEISIPKKIALDLIMIFFISGVIMVSFMKIMWVSKYIFSANYAVDNLEKLYLSMQEDKLLYGKKTNFENYNIEFNSVSFSYGEKKVLENLSFKLHEGKTYALVGHSGSGKSTIAKLLSGFYKVDSGVIKVGGCPLEDYTKDAIINNISFIFQDSKLFKKSIYDNIAIGKEGATRAEIMRAIKLSGCDDIINKLKDRENTIIGTKGVYLSGGETQRIAIARAILKDSPIVIMDEASASIDSDNEYKLQKAFKNLMNGKTVIMIAHRMTSIKNVDEIIVLENGNIIERGNNEELINKGGSYSKLLALYQTANDWRV